MSEWYSMTRKERGKKQNIFLIETIPPTSKYERKYDVVGMTGNVYTITISNSPTCTCPDHTTRFRRCKHIYFILIRVMHVDEDDEDKAKFTNEELEKMFDSIPDITNNLIADNKHREAYEKLKDKKDEPIKKKSINDLCPICLDDLDNGDELDYCKYSCGKNIHKECFQMWAKSKSLHCIFCRKEWNVPTSGKYINLY